MKKPYVFISYSSKEADVANLVYSYLEGNGIACWIASRNIEGGESYAAQIVDAINDCSAFVLMASSSSNASPHVSNELSLAMSSAKRIIPFRLQNFELTKDNTYFLQRSQWIDAYDNMNEALKLLRNAVRGALPQTEAAAPVSHPEIIPEPHPTAEAAETEDDGTPEFTRDEIVNILLAKIEKFPYCLKDRTRGENYDRFSRLSSVLFKNTLSMSYKGKLTAGGVDFVDIIVDTLSQGQNVSIQVKGLPGCAKNMLLQLAYYKMLENFRHGESNYLPVYLSSSYYEKRRYTEGSERAEMTAIIAEELKEYFGFLKKNPDVRPVLMVEAIREHIVAGFAPEDVILDLWRPIGKFNRITAIDVGLIKNRMRLKRTIPLIGDTSGYTFSFHSVPISDKPACLETIRAILDMYIDKYEGLEEADVYSALNRLRFPTLDIFIARLIATELSQGHSADDISLTDMYERLAMTDLGGDEDKMLTVANELYEYIFNDRYSVKNKKYNAVLWSLPHKHSTYLEFMIAYRFGSSVLNFEDGGSIKKIFSLSLSAMENHFMVSRMQDNYRLQETLLKLADENYGSLDMISKSNAAYWLGKLTFADLRDRAKAILDAEFKRLKPIVKNDNSQTLDNRRNQYLFRSVCHGLIAHGCTDILDEYLCLIVINDVANAINRGTMIEYTGDSYRAGVHNDFYLDTNPNIGEQAVRILASRVESRLMSKKSGYVETDLVSLLTLVQARMHTPPEKLSYNLTPYCEKCLELLEEYRSRPRSIVSDKLLYYFRSVSEDLAAYIEKPRFDAAFTLFTELSKMKEAKRTQWTQMGIDDPESVAEHTLGAWMLAMVFLPQEYAENGYSKKEIMDMLLVHDMAEAVLGDCPTQLSEPTKELKKQNDLLRRMFLRGTYPEVANMTYYYNVWTGYFNGQNINARIARDINLIQTVNTFFSYCAAIDDPEKLPCELITSWANESSKISTDLGYDLFERIIRQNYLYRKVFAAARKNRDK